MAKLKAIGTDVEFFGQIEGQIHPLAPGMIPGTKKKPHIINKTYDLGLQLDNVLGEITFKPCFCADEFEDLCLASKEDMSDYLAKKDIFPVYKSSHIFEAMQLMTRHARHIGCAPDEPAVEGDSCDPVDPLLFNTVRTASGHLHFSFEEELSHSDIIQYVRGLDRAIGGPLCVLHADALRRKIYGQAGRFRLKPDYPGFEYRTPDNFWYAHSASLAREIYEVAEYVFSIPLTAPVWEKVNASHKALAKDINLGHVPALKEELGFINFPSISI